MDLTREETEYRITPIKDTPPTPIATRGSPHERFSCSEHFSAPIERRMPPPPRAGHPARRVPLGMDKAPVTSVDALLAACTAAGDDWLQDHRVRGHCVALGVDERVQGRRSTRWPPACSESASAYLRSMCSVWSWLAVDTTGMIRSTMSAVPERLPVLPAKSGVYALVALIVAVPSVFVAFFAGQAILSGQHIQVAFSHPGVASAIFGATGYVSLVGLFGMRTRCDHAQHRGQGSRGRGDHVRRAAARRDPPSTSPIRYSVSPELGRRR